MWTQAERRALRYIATGEYDKAISEYQKLLSEVGDDPDIYNAIGDLYIKKNDPEKAVEAYQKAIELYEKDGLVENAIAVARKALRYDESNKYLYLTLSELYGSVGRHDEALGYLSAFIDRGVEREDVKRLQAVFKELASSISRDMERQKRFERLFNKFEKIIEELGEISLEEARKKFEESGGKHVSFSLEEGKCCEEQQSEEQFTQPSEEQPEGVAATPELSDEDIDKLAEWPTEEVEQQIWGGEGLETPKAETAEPISPQEPWEYEAEAPAGPEQAVVQEAPPSPKPASFEPQPAPEEHVAEQRPSQEPVEHAFAEQEDVTAILDEILGEKPEQTQPAPSVFEPAVEQLPEEPIEPPTPPAPEPHVEELIEPIGVEPTLPFEETKPPTEEYGEKISPVEEFLKATEEKKEITEEFPAVETAKEVPGEVPGKEKILAILTELRLFLLSSNSLYYPNLKPAEFGRILMNMKLYEEAFRQFQKALLYMDISDKSSGIFDVLKLGGIALFNAKKYRLAIKQFEKALKLNGRDPELYYLVGLSHEKLGNFREALDAYENAYLLDVDFRDVADRIAALADIERR